MLRRTDWTNFPGGFYVDFSAVLPGVKTEKIAWRWMAEINSAFKGADTSIGEPSFRLLNYAGGIELSTAMAGKVLPFGQILLGGSHFSAGDCSGEGCSENGFLFGLDGGARFPVSGKISAEASIGWGHVSFKDDPVNYWRIKAGINIPLK